MHLKKNYKITKGKIFPFGVISLDGEIAKYVKNKADNLYFFSENLLKYNNDNYTFAIDSENKGIKIFLKSKAVEFISEKDLKHVDVLRVKVYDPGYLLNIGNLKEGIINNGRSNIFLSKCLKEFELDGRVNHKDKSAFLKVDESLIGKDFLKLEFYDQNTKKDLNIFKVFSEQGENIEFELSFPFKNNYSYN